MLPDEEPVIPIETGMNLPYIGLTIGVYFGPFF